MTAAFEAGTCQELKLQEQIQKKSRAVHEPLSAWKSRCPEQVDPLGLPGQVINALKSMAKGQNLQHGKPGAGEHASANTCTRRLRTLCTRSTATSVLVIPE